MNNNKTAMCAVAGAALIASSAFAGPEWIEQDDAGSNLATAQPTLGSGPLQSIAGRLGVVQSFLGGTDYEDLFLITVQSPSLFTMQVTSADFDAQLFVFNVTLPGQLFGLLANNDTVLGDEPFVGNMATDSTGAQLLLPGVYVVGISGLGRNPLSNTGAIFNFQSQTEVSGADGPGGINPLSGWTGEGQTGEYIIDVTGVTF